VNPVDVLRYGQRTIDELVGRLRTDDWEAVALGVWTTKDLVGHLGVFEVRFADILAVNLGESPESNVLQVDYTTFNDDQAAIRSAWSVPDVLDEYRGAYDRVMRLAGRVPEARWTTVGTIPWYGPEYSLDDLLVYSMYGHKREHAPQLEAILERPGRP
jgi:hypothetical protein